MVSVPASAAPAVSANIPRVPEISRSLALMVMLPPPSVLVESEVTVALIWASWPMSMVLASMLIEPGLPAPRVSVVRLVFCLSVRLLASISIVPAFPVPWVSALSLLLLVSSMF